MYGMINKAVEDLVTSRFGAAKWVEIRERAGVSDAAFVNMEKYPDETTYRLVGAASEVLGAPPEQILEAFGEYWTVYSAEAGFGPVLDFAGRTLVEFLSNLDNMHTRVALSFPKLEPPSFRTSEVTDRSLRLHYYSGRPGLAPLVIGMVKGLGKRFDTPLTVQLDRSRADGIDHDQFVIHFGKGVN